MAKDVKVQIVGDASKYKAALNEASAATTDFTGKSKASSDQISKFGTKALLAGGLIAGGLFKAGDAASHLGESINAVRVTFGDAADGILKIGENAAQALGLSKTEFNGLAVQFSNFATTVAGKGGDVVGTMKELTGRVADFASVLDLDVPEAGKIFQSALAGETEPIRKFGIDLSAAAVNAYAAANGIGTLGAQLSESEKVTARYGLLMQATAKDQGDFAATSDGAAGSMRKAKAEMANATAELGTSLAPVIADVATKLSGLVSGFSALNDASGGAVVTLAEFAAGSLLLVGGAAKVIAGLQKMHTALRLADGSMTGLGTAVNAAIPLVTVATLAIVAHGQAEKNAANRTKELTDNMSELASVANDQVAETFGHALAAGFSQMALDGKKASDVFDEMAHASLIGAERALEWAKANGQSQVVIDGLTAAIAKESSGQKEAEKATKDAQAALDKQADTTDELTKSTDGATGGFAGFYDAASLAEQATDDLKNATDEATRKSDAFAKSVQNQIDKLAELYPKEYDAVKAKYDYRDAVEDSTEKLDALNVTLGDHKATQEDVKGATDAARDSIISQSEKYATLDGAALGSEGAIRRQITSLEAQATTLGPNAPLRTFLREYIADLDRIASNISTELSLHISSGSVTTKDGDTIGKRGGPQAAGGPVSAGVTYPVGEKGMELFTPSTNGTITPNDALGGGAAGPVTNNYITLHPVGLTESDLVRLLKKYEQRNGPGWRNGAGGISGGTP